MNDEFKNQNAKIIENEVKLNEQQHTLTLLTKSNDIQREIIQKHDAVLNEHQNMLMNCIENVKGLYQETNEIRNNLIEEDKKINQLALKNEAEINEIRVQCKEGLEKVNEITQILNKHTEILTEQSTAIAKLQAISIKNTEKIDEICQTLFNHESRINNLEERVDNIEKVLKKHEEAILNLTGDVSNMKVQMKEVLERLKKIEGRLEKIERGDIQKKADKIFKFLDKMNDNGLYELANFILELRNMNRPFNLQNVADGIKIIAEKNPN
jgi:chromosome segregation ATPase